MPLQLSATGGLPAGQLTRSKAQARPNRAAAATATAAPRAAPPSRIAPSPSRPHTRAGAHASAATVCASTAMIQARKPSSSATTRVASFASQMQRRGAVAARAAKGGAPPAPRPTEDTGKFISRTEVPAFIQRDDMMDQLYQWSGIEAGEGGYRNFGLPMTVDPGEPHACCSATGLSAGENSRRLRRADTAAPPFDG
eukprot:229099-Chlamydomonas_euryale.AAC.2